MTSALLRAFHRTRAAAEALSAALRDDVNPISPEMLAAHRRILDLRFAELLDAAQDCGHPHVAELGSSYAVLTERLDAVDEDSLGVDAHGDDALDDDSLAA